MKSHYSRLLGPVAALAISVPAVLGLSKPASAAPAACNNTVQEYAVSSGDTLSKIAEAAFGDPRQWPRIFEYPGNTGAIGRNPNLLTIGVRLQIPPCPGAIQSIPQEAAPAKTARVSKNSGSTTTSLPIKLYVVTGDDWPPYVSTDCPQGGMAVVIVEALSPNKRPVSATADYTEVRDVTRVEVREDPSVSLHLLFDPEHNLEQRIIGEQFQH